jgi:hypothetical protein
MFREMEPSGTDRTARRPGEATPPTYNPGSSD